MPPSRNDPCPCGSGKKYKQCCLRKDEKVATPLRLVRTASGGDAHGFDLRDRDISSRWEVDAVATPIGLADTPDARPVLTIVAADDAVLAIDLVARPPAEPEGITRLLIDAIDRARAATGREPADVVVRHDEYVGPLAASFGAAPVRIVVQRELPSLDAMFDDLAGRALGVPMEELFETRSARVSRPERWAGWGHPPELIGRLFAAAAAYYRAAPWLRVTDEDVIVATFPDGRQWALAVMGSAGEAFGLAMYASLDDLRALLEPVIETAPEALAHIRAATISLLFDERETISAGMRREIRDAGWEVVDRNAYPVLMPMNTPAGGIARRQLEDLIVLLDAVCGFLARHEQPFEEWAEKETELRWTSGSVDGLVLTYDGPWGADPAMPWAPADTLRPSCAAGTGATPEACFGFGVDLDAAELAQEERYVAPFERWLLSRTPPSKGTVRGLKATVRVARAFCEFVVFEGRVPISAVSELELRTFVYEHFPQTSATDADAKALLPSLERFFTYLDEVESIESPWREEVIDDEEAFWRRWESLPANPDSEQMVAWLVELMADLALRALTPSGEVLFNGRTFEEAVRDPGLHDDIDPAVQRRWLARRDAVIRAGVTEPMAVRERVAGEWQP